MKQLKLFANINTVKHFITSKCAYVNGTFKLSQSEQVITEIENSTKNVVSALYRCAVDDPLKHDVQHAGKFYKLSDDDYQLLDPLKKLLRTEYVEKWTAFDENTLMIRKPAIELINYIKRLDLSNLAYRFLLYGNQPKTGKRSTAFHVAHYCLKNDWLLFTIPDAGNEFRVKATKYEDSTYKQGRVDTPVYATNFLKGFLQTNSNLLKKLNLKTTKKYNWGERESTEAGTSLIDLIEFGNSRVKYASDICGILVKEIKQQAKPNNIKVLVTVNQLNAYYGPTRLARSDKADILVDEITVSRNFKKLLKSDWTNAVIVGILNAEGHIIQDPRRHKKHYDMTITYAHRRRVQSKLWYEGPLTPQTLLKKEGFHALEPFVPIFVPKYADYELTSQFEYYKDRSWLQNPLALDDEAKEELKFLSGRNPFEFMRICSSL